MDGRYKLECGGLPSETFALGIHWPARTWMAACSLVLAVPSRARRSWGSLWTSPDWDDSGIVG